jgi:hypothetical protein
MIRLKNDRLEVHILEPGKQYHRSRFDWGGICQQITLDGEITFCSQEASDNEPGTDGIGLIDEFGIETPIGYHEILVGEWFPKIGVGFLQKVNEEPYNFMVDYPLQTMPIQVAQANGIQVNFEQKSAIINGWGWCLQKSYTLKGTNLSIDYALENIGQKTLVTEQYNHNFIAIHRQTVGSDYQLETSFPLNCGIIDGGIQIEGNSLGLTETPPVYIYALQTDCNHLQNVEWEIKHQTSGHVIHVKEYFPLFKFALWAKRHVISPEFFIWIDLQPGETQTWQRVYSFF